VDKYKYLHPFVLKLYGFFCCAYQNKQKKKSSFFLLCLGLGMHKLWLDWFHYTLALLTRWQTRIEFSYFLKTHKYSIVLIANIILILCQFNTNIIWVCRKSSSNLLSVTIKNVLDNRVELGWNPFNVWLNISCEPVQWKNYLLFFLTFCLSGKMEKNNQRNKPCIVV
jgi:hypothetical protein